MAIKFSSPVRHGTIELFPGVSLAFEDPDAEPYFLALGWAEVTEDSPVRTYSQDEVSIDPLTRDGSTGKFVLPDHPAVAEASAEATPGISPANIPQEA